MPAMNIDPTDPGDALQILRAEIVLASRILAAEQVLDSFGHVSARHPARPDRFLLSRVRAPELVAEADLEEVDLDGRAARPDAPRLPLERALHAEMYRARPDVHAVCHHHAPGIQPFCITSLQLVPVTHLGATMGWRVPVWDSRDEFGDTDLLVATPQQGRSLARTLGPDWTVLMRHHGATVVGRDVKELVMRAVQGVRNAELMLRSVPLGGIEPLTPGECNAAAKLNLSPLPLGRAWELWTRRVNPHETTQETTQET